MKTKASPKTILALASCTAAKIQSFNPDHDNVQNVIGDSRHPYWKAIESIFGAVAPTAGVIETQRHIFESSQRFKVANTNLDKIVTITEDFAKKFLGVAVNLRKGFDFPVELPWKDTLLVFDPGINNYNAVKKSLLDQKLEIYEEDDVMEYSGSEASGAPTLHVIENSIQPTKDTLIMTPDQLMIDGNSYLSLRGYALAFGLRHFAFSDHLDPETWTWFPENRLHGCVAAGCWCPRLSRNEVGFSSSKPDYSNPVIGARLSILIPRKL